MQTDPILTDPLPTETEPLPVETTPTASTTQPTQPSQPSEVVDTPDDSELVLITDYIPAISVELAYATADNFTGQIVYDFTDAYLRYGTVAKLAQVCQELEESGLGLKIWDAFRPVSAQAKLWVFCPDATYVSHPVTGNRSHCRGSAVDVTLIDLETGEELEMPTGFDDFSAQADRDYSDCSDEAARNATLLEQIMEKYGFKGYSAEWWHFSDCDTYEVEENFDPAAPVIWEANCSSYLSLYKSAGESKVLAKVYGGKTVELLSWEGRYAKVSYQGKVGYLPADYLKPADMEYFSRVLDTVELTSTYTYKQMVKDLQSLAEKYPDKAVLDSIGTSELGRDIPVLRIGSEDAQYHVLLQGAMHGREHMTAWLLVAMADYWLDHGILGYGDVCYHIIPMSNPDGVVISQTCTLNEAQKEIYQNDLALGNTELSESSYARLWKANGLGVDINRNFAAGWDELDSRTDPSSQEYKGESAFSSAEARALRDYTLRYSFGTTISYHAFGSDIFYEYGTNKTVNAQSKSLGTAVQAITAYRLKGSERLDSGGYKDWVMEELGIPSLTIEVGCYGTPLLLREMYSVFVRNYQILPTIALWLQK